MTNIMTVLEDSVSKGENNDSLGDIGEKSLQV